MCEAMRTDQGDTLPYNLLGEIDFPLMFGPLKPC